MMKAVIDVLETMGEADPNSVNLLEIYKAESPILNDENKNGRPKETMALVKVSAGAVHNANEGAGKSTSISRHLQLELFDELPKELQTKTSSVLDSTETALFKGIDWEDDAGYKVLTALVTMLWKKSQHTHENDKDYMMGNGINSGIADEYLLPKPVSYDGKRTAFRPIIITSKAEWATEYTGKERVSGAEMNQAYNKLEYFSGKQFLIVPKKYGWEPYINKKGEEKKRRIAYSIPDYREAYKLRIIEKEEQDIDKDGNPVRNENGEAVMRKKATALMIELDYVFIEDIKDRFVTIPMDLTSRVREAYKDVTGSTRQPDTLLTFIYKLLGVQNFKGNGNDLEPRTYRCKERHQIGQESEEHPALYAIIGNKYLRDGKLAKCKELLDIYIKVAEKIGLLEEHKVKGKDFEKVHYFRVREPNEWVKRFTTSA